MKKNKYLLIAIILSIFCSLGITLAYFKSSTDLISIFKTKSYSIKINGTGGTFSGENVTIIGGKTTLPTPIRNGYQFLGYGNNQDGNTDYSVDISDINQINNKEIYAIWNIINYKIDYNLNGGTLDNLKTSYNVLETFTLSNPIKSGYNFSGWTGSNGNTKQMSVTVSKGTTGNLNYVANWSANSYLVDVNPIIDGVTYNAGLSGYTFDVWVNETLVADDVIDWCQNVIYGSTVRVKANSHDGMSTDYDKTITVGVNGATMSPSWSKNYYKVSYYVNNNLYKEESVGYGDEINIPNYAYNPWEVFDGWSNNITTMPSYDIRIDGYYHEANCYVWAGHPKSQNGYAIVTQVVKAAKNDFTGVIGPYESTTPEGVVLWTMHTDSSLKYSQVMTKLPISMNRYTWWSYAEVHCDNGYAFGYNK